MEIRPLICSMSDGREERMVGTIQQTVGRPELKRADNWYKLYETFVSGYRRRPQQDGICAFELLYEVKPRLVLHETPSFWSNDTSEQSVELFYTSCLRVDRAIRNNKRIQTTNCIAKYSVCDLVLLTNGKAIVTSTKMVCIST